MRLSHRATVLLLALAGASVFSAPASAQAGWSSDPLIAADDCKEVSYEKSLSFLNSHFVPAVALLSDSKSSETDVLQAYAISTALTLRSQQCLAEALQLKGLTEKFKAEQAVIKSGTSLGKNEIEKQRQLTEEADAAIRQAATEQLKLTPEQRKSFGLGVGTYLAGSYATSQLVTASEKVLQDNKGKGGGVSKLSLKSLKDTAGSAKYVALVGEIATGVSGQLKRLTATSQTLVAYCKTNKIDLPADATSKLDSFASWGK